MGEPILLLGIASALVPVMAAPFLPRDVHALRRAASAACVVAAACAAVALAQVRGGHQANGPLAAWVVLDGLSGAAMVLHAGIAALTFGLAPVRDLTRGRGSAVLALVSATLLSYLAGSPIGLLAGWTFSALLFAVGPFAVTASWRPRAALAASCVALAVGLAQMALAGPRHGLSSVSVVANSDPGGAVAFSLLMLAIVLRTGIIPAHAWIADSAQDDPLPSSLLFNGHLGAWLLVRVVVPLFPDAVHGSFLLLSDLALVTAVYAAIRAVAEPAPRRLLALIVLSQSAYILAGLESGTAEGTTGALLQVAVVSVATTGLFGVLRAVEARCGAVDLERYHGLVHPLPRLAVAFAVCAFALVGLPGTLGFAASELLLHGSLVTHPHLGVLLPLATALNAFCLFRMFGRVFLGRSAPLVAGIAEARARERWTLAGIVFLLVGAGIVPGLRLGGTSSSADPHHPPAAARQRLAP